MKFISAKYEVKWSNTKVDSSITVKSLEKPGSELLTVIIHLSRARDLSELLFKSQKVRDISECAS